MTIQKKITDAEGKVTTVVQHWEDEAKIVVGMLADEIDAARRAENAHAIGRAV